MADLDGCERSAAVEARVASVAGLCRGHVAIELVAPALPASQPGQFLQLRCCEAFEVGARVAMWSEDGFPSLAGPDWREPRAFLRRPFSIADRWDDNEHTHVVVISRTIGAGTRWLARLRPGERVNLIGPLGQGFKIPGPDTPVVLAGGGVGIPPLLYLARRLRESRHRDVTVVFGATTRDLLPVSLVDEPAGDGTPRTCATLPGGAEFPVIITSDDGSVGVRGRVTDGIELWQARRARAKRRGVVLACGPEPMLQSVAELTRRLGLDCQLCIERRMGCGLGTCQSCVVRAREPAGGWRWALTCADGPVFDRDDLLDYETPARVVE